MKNLTLLEVTAENEDDVIYQAIVMQKFLNFFEALNSHQENFSKTLKTAFLAMIELHPDKAKEAMSAYADLTDMVLMSVEYHNQLVELSGNYYTLQKVLEDKQDAEFATKNKPVTV